MKTISKSKRITNLHKQKYRKAVILIRKTRDLYEWIATHENELYGNYVFIKGKKQPSKEELVGIVATLVQNAKTSIDDLINKK